MAVSLPTKPYAAGRTEVLLTTGYSRNAIVHHGRIDAGVHMIGKPFSLAN